MLYENGKTPTLIEVGGGNDYYNVGNNARWKWTTSARYLEVDSYATSTNSVGRLGVRVSVGATKRDYWYQTPPTANAPFTSRLWLPKGVDKTVELYVPSQNATSVGGTPQGVYPIRVRFDQAATAIAPSLEANHLVIYGDSIASGGVGVCPTLLGYPGLLKRGAAFGGYDGSVTVVSWGFRRLADDCDTAQKRIDFAAHLLSLNPTKILLAIGSNDHSVIPAITLANFTTYYEGLLNQLIAQHPTVPIVCMSPIRRGNEGANHLGNTMAEFRTVISNAVAARSSRCTYLDGLPICDLADLPDQVHPGTAGNIKMRDAILAAV